MVFKILRQTPSGWVNDEEFRIVIEEKFLTGVRLKRDSNIFLKDQRTLLILDGHSTQMQRKIWEVMKENNVDVICFPSHTSNFTQPLDLCVNSQFKKELQITECFPKKMK
jgi:hypothetical protein